MERWCSLHQCSRAHIRLGSKVWGLYQNDACIPLPNEHGIEDEGHLHLGQVAKLIGHPTLIDSETQTVVIGQPSAVRSSALKDRIAPDFKLPDIHGIDALSRKKDY